jgi:hypothetical protein
MTPGQMYVSGAVEGVTDEAILVRVVRAAGADVLRTYAKGGKAALKQALLGYNNAARFQPWVVLLDMDDDASCPAELVAKLLAKPSPRMRLRIAVRQVEAWILADAQRVAHFLGVSQHSVPDKPEHLPNAKEALVNLARRSRYRAIREDMVPRAGSGRPVGAAYPSRLIDFVSNDTGGWRPEVAAQRAPSLARCIAAVRSLVS